MRIAILLNGTAGDMNRRLCEQRAHEILAACNARRIEATVHVCQGARLTSRARELADSSVDAVVAAGGDGTVSAVAAGLADARTDVALGVVPLGTLNHFAKDLGVATVEAAIDTIAAGHTERIDLGEVNGRVFVNNSSIGLYADMIEQRDAERRRHGARKWPAMLRAALRALFRFPLLYVAISFAGNAMWAHTPIVFVGNNEYSHDVRAFGTRRRLDRGTLAVYTIRATHRFRMFWILVRTLFRRDETRGFEAHAVQRAEIAAGKRTLRVALDGEVVRMRPPLTYRSRPGALRVLTPLEEAAA